MPSEPSSETSGKGDAPTAFGVTRTPSEEDGRRDPVLLAALRQIAPGTELRQSLDDIIRSGEGALIVIGDPDQLSFLYSGGMRLDLPFTQQLLYELAKMDGAIVVDESLSKLAYANVQLMPDPTIPSGETGTRHRTAERVAKQTGALVISVSQQRSTISVYRGTVRYQLDPVTDVLAKTNQAMATLDTYSKRLEEVLTRLTALEFQNAVVLDDVLVVLQRAQMTIRIAAFIERDCVELGTESRVIRMQLAELVGGIPGQRDAVVRDYDAEARDDAHVDAVVAGLDSLRYRELRDLERLSELLHYPRDVNPLDYAVVPRGFRVLSHVPRLPDQIVRRVVEGMGDLEAIVRASQRDLESIAGVGEVRAREIREGLRRLQEHNLVDRYLQL